VVIEPLKVTTEKKTLIKEQVVVIIKELKGNKQIASMIISPQLEISHRQKVIQHYVPVIGNINNKLVLAVAYKWKDWEATGEEYYTSAHTQRDKWKQKIRHTLAQELRAF